MQKSNFLSVLQAVYPKDLSDALLDSYEKALSNYKKGQWKYFGNEIGQFIEIARRIIENALENKYTPLSEKLSIFNEKVLTFWENHSTTISESYRIIIPRCLYAMYCMRNKRGMIHKNQIDPNKMDATILLYNAKWVLAELFRLASSLSFTETEDAINSIISKESSIIWNNGEIIRILDVKMSAKNKVLCLLYTNDRCTDTLLQKSTEYKNTSEFKKILRAMHKDRLIEYTNGICLLSPTGQQIAEELLSK